MEATGDVKAAAGAGPTGWLTGRTALNAPFPRELNPRGSTVTVATSSEASETASTAGFATVREFWNFGVADAAARGGADGFDPGVEVVVPPRAVRSPRRAAEPRAVDFDGALEAEDTVEPSCEPVSAPATATLERTALPTPKTTARLPTRPTYLEALIDVPRCGYLNSAEPRHDAQTVRNGLKNDTSLRWVTRWRMAGSSNSLPAVTILNLVTSPYDVGTVECAVPKRPLTSWTKL